MQRSSALGDRSRHTRPHFAAVTHDRRAGRTLRVRSRRRRTMTACAAVCGGLIPKQRALACRRRHWATSATTTSSRMASPTRTAGRLTTKPTHAPTAASRIARPAARARLRSMRARQSSAAVRRRPHDTGEGSWGCRDPGGAPITRQLGLWLARLKPRIAVRISWTPMS